MNCIPASELLLRTRAREVVSYLRFLRIAVEKNVKVTANTTQGELEHRMPRNLTYTFKANLYLLLYSAMEATFTQLIYEMHDVIGANANSLDSLRSELFMLIIKSFKKNSIPLSIEMLPVPISQVIMDSWCKEWRNKTKAKDKRKGTFAGNVDGLLMHEHLLSYGVVVGVGDEKKPQPRLTHRSLEYAKDRRNQLAHGELGFSELGRGQSFEELKDHARAIFETLVRIAQEINKYLLAKGYLKDSTWNREL
jgi:hypothetical protein